MRKLGILLALLAAQPAVAADAANRLFYYTHLLPSPFTIPAGRLVFGADVSLGLTDFLQVGTNVLRDFYKVYNVNAKLSLVNYPEAAFAVTGEYEHYNYKDILATNPDLKVTSWLPGAVFAFALDPRLAMFVGGNLNITNAVLVTNGIATSGYTHGARVGADASFAYNAPSKKQPIGNVLSAGVSYDLSYKIYGFGFSHHWPGFHLGIHYYPNADQYRVQPILVGGGSVNL
jgi:hypothetical protein